MTGEVVEVGPSVEWVKKGDLVSVPFNVSCGTCRNCKEAHAEVCLRVNPFQPMGAYGYFECGGWQGGQAHYNLIPYADYNCLVIKDKEAAMLKILDIALLSDVLPTAMHGCVEANVSPGKSVFISGAGPIGLAAAEISSKLLGAAHVFIGDINKERLELAKSIPNVHILDLSSSKTDVAAIVKEITGKDGVDCSVECVGFEASAEGRGTGLVNNPSQTLQDVMEVTRSGGSIGILGVFGKVDQGASTPLGKSAILPLRLGEAWMKSHSFHMGQYNHYLLECIMQNKINPSKILNCKVVGLEDAEKAYEDFAKGVPVKFVFDPHGIIRSYQHSKEHSIPTIPLAKVSSSTEQSVHT